MNDFSENSTTCNVIDPMSAAMLAAKNGEERPTADQYATDGQLVPESLRLQHDIITAAITPEIIEEYGKETQRMRDEITAIRKELKELNEE